jgi:RHS repeat-associated protein
VVIQSDPTGAALIGVVDPNPWGGYNSLNPFGWIGQPGYWYENGLRRPLYYVRARWYQTGGPNWLSPDPLRFGGGDFNLYRYVGNRPTVGVDPSGLNTRLDLRVFAALPPISTPKGVPACGTCGAIADNWIGPEIDCQIQGYNKFSSGFTGAVPITRFAFWCNGNQRYKDPSEFMFNQHLMPPCGTQPQPKQIGCGASVTLCGYCVRNSVLGNIMYGYIGRFAGFTLDQITQAAINLKRIALQTVDDYDKAAYELGYDIRRALEIDNQGFCTAFKKNSIRAIALREGRKDDGSNYNDLSTCSQCHQSTKETNHGGHYPERILP